MTSANRLSLLFVMPLLVAVFAFFLLPMGELFVRSFFTRDGTLTYLAILKTPRYLASLWATLVIACLTTLITLVIATLVGLYLSRATFPGRMLLVSILTFPLAFPGVVVGFLIILLGGRQGLVGDVTLGLTGEKVVFAYSPTGLLLGYLYFSIPRVLLTMMAAAEKLDPAMEEAARSLGAGPWRVLVDIVIPALAPALLASGALAFATAMGAFGTAFTLATNIDVLPMVIYTEFTLNANIAMSAALSMILGLLTWFALVVARQASGSSVAAAG